MTGSGAAIDDVLANGISRTMRVRGVIDPVQARFADEAVAGRKTGAVSWMRSSLTFGRHSSGRKREDPSR